MSEQRALHVWVREKSKVLVLFITPTTLGYSHGDLYVGENLEGKRIENFVRKA